MLVLVLVVLVLLVLLVLLVVLAPGSLVPGSLVPGPVVGGGGVSVVPPVGEPVPGFESDEVEGVVVTPSVEPPVALDSSSVRSVHANSRTGHRKARVRILAR